MTKRDRDRMTRTTLRQQSILRNLFRWVLVWNEEEGLIDKPTWSDVFYKP